VGRIWVVWLGIWIGWGAANGLERDIVVSYGSERNTVEQQQTTLESLIRTSAMQALLSEMNASIVVKKAPPFWVLQLGPVEADERLVPILMSIRERFPNAVLQERSRADVPVHRTKSPEIVRIPIIQTAEKTDDAIENITIWTALFGLAIIGILYMFLSSDQLRRIKKEHAHILKRQKELEVKQHTLLAQMGENIYSLARETADHTQSLAKNAQGALLHDDVQKVIERENTLLGMTSDLIKFLQIKARKVTIQNAPFDFNNVLHEVAGTLHGSCENSGKELVFDVARDVPKMMQADSLHMAQVLIGLIEYFMCDTDATKVYLNALIRTSSDKTRLLDIRIRSDIDGIDEESFFDAYYDEKSGKYIGLGVFVAKELVSLMGGELTLEERKGETTHLHIVFPVGRGSMELRQYHLPDRSVMEKKVLISDHNPDAMRALAHYLDYFKMETVEMPIALLQDPQTDLTPYDIIAIDDTVLDAALAARIRSQRTQDNLQVILLENLYSGEENPHAAEADIRMKKPLTQQHVYDVLVQLSEASTTAERVEKEPQKRGENLPEVYRGDFEDIPSITLEDFSRFSGRRVLIVEDNLVNQKVLRGMLSKAGLLLHFADNGQEALALLEQMGDTRIEMILMDISMPVMDGFTATRRIHNDPRWQGIPIVTLTALVSEHEIEKMFDSGANGYLSKPLKIGRLYSAMVRFFPAEKSAAPNEHSQPDSGISVTGGLDTRQVIGTMQEDTLLYREVLREFRDLYGKSDVVLEKLIDDARYEQFQTLCLDLRGLSGSIGARELFDVVSQMLNLLAEDRYTALRKEVGNYRGALKRLEDAIDRYLS